MGPRARTIAKMNALLGAALVGCAARDQPRPLEEYELNPHQVSDPVPPPARCEESSAPQVAASFSRRPGEPVKLGIVAQPPSTTRIERAALLLGVPDPAPISLDDTLPEGRAAELLVDGRASSATLTLTLVCEDQARMEKRFALSWSKLDEISGAAIRVEPQP